MSNNKPKLEWISHPFVDNLKSSILLVIFLIFMAVVLWIIAVRQWEMPIFYYLGLLIFIISLMPYFIPTTYKFFDDKIRIFYWFIKVERSYNDFKCYYADKKGVMLGTFRKPRRLDSFRGQSIRFSKSQQEKAQLMELLAEKIGNKV